MWTWIKRIVKVVLIIVVILIIAMAVMLYFAPISNPAIMISQIFGYSAEPPSQTTVAQRLRAPDGFTIEKYATGLANIRILQATPTGDLIASQPREGKVILLKRDMDGDGKHDGKVELLKDLYRPHGLALYNNHLYVAESNAIGRVAFNSATGSLEGPYERVIRELPDGGNHWSKSILIFQDKLYVSIGSSCNVCEEADERRATIMTFDIDGNNGEIYADGLRNSVGLDIAPWSGALYATDNGRDMLGDDYPPCELNKIEQGGFYGWPYINGFGDMDPDLGSGKEELLTTSTSPVFGFRAHNAPLGIEFLDKATMPAGYHRSALVALHGSWNRREPDGYKVVSLHWQEDGSIVSKDFLSGFEKQGNIIGRPVDIEEGVNGCLYLSDDYTGTVYKVCYDG